MMAEMKISLRLAGIGAAVTDFGKLAGQMKAVAELQETVLRNQERFAASGRQLVNSNPVMSGGASAPPSAKAGKANITGPFSRLMKAHEQFREAMRRGVDSEILDAATNLQSAQTSAARAQKRLQPKTFSDRLMDVLGTSRFSLGGGGGQLMPLVNKVGSLFGNESGQLNPFGLFGKAAPKGPQMPAGIDLGGMIKGLGGDALAGAGGEAAGALGGLAGVAGVASIAVTGVVAVVGALVKGVQQATTSLSEFRSAVMLTGGSVQDVARLNAYGLDPKDIARRAQAFRERTQIGGDVFGQIARAKLGMSPVGDRRFSVGDEAGDYLKAIEGLRNIKDPLERLQVARNAGVEDLLKLANTSDAVFKKMQQDARMLQQVNGDPKAAQAAADLEASQSRYWSNMSALMTSVFKPIIPLFDQWIGTAADGIRSLTQLWERGPGRMWGAAGNVLGRFFDVVGRLVGHFAQMVSHSKAFQTAVKWISEGTEWVIKSLNALADAMPELPAVIGKALQKFAEAIKWTSPAGFLASSGLTKAGDELIKAGEQLKKDIKADRDAALKANTAAVNANTAAVNHASGTWGGGARARSAVSGPGRIQDPEMRREWLRQQVYSLGFFGR